MTPVVPVSRLLNDVCICNHLFLVHACVWHRVESRGQENEGYRGETPPIITRLWRKITPAASIVVAVEIRSGEYSPCLQLLLSFVYLDTES